MFLKAVLIPLLALAAPAADRGPSLKFEAGLRNTQLPAGVAGDTFLRIAVTGERAVVDRRLPLDIALVIDRSGSMGAAGPKGSEKMSDAREAAKFLLSQLSEADIVSVVSFDNGAEVLVAATPATPEAIARARARIDGLYARGGTDMAAGLKTGTDQAVAGKKGERVSRILLISDGRPNTDQGLLALARGAVKKGINVSTLGVGLDYNEDLMAAIANAGTGNYHFVADAAALAGVFGKELRELMAVVAKETTLKVQFASGVTPVKVHGWEAELNGETAIIRVGDVYGGQTAEVLVRVHHPAHQGQKLVARVEASYHDALARRARSEGREVTAQFTRDAAAVSRSVDRKVAAKAQLVLSAEATTEAMDQLKAGRRDAARAIIARHKGELAAGAAAFDDERLQQEAGRLDHLDATLSAAAAPTPAQAEEMAKENKARARVNAH